MEDLCLECQLGMVMKSRLRRSVSPSTMLKYVENVPCFLVILFQSFILGSSRSETGAERNCRIP